MPQSDDAVPVSVDVTELPGGRTIARAVQVLVMPRVGDSVNIRGDTYSALHALHTFRPGATPRITLFVQVP